MTLSSSLKKVADRKKSGPVWKGPEEDGITFSLLSRFLSCRERFRLLVVEGLRPKDIWNHRIGYGEMWHVCEQALAEHGGGGKRWTDDLLFHCRNLCKQYPTQQELIDHWYNVCKIQFPIYVDYWSKHPDVKSRTPLLQEQVFDVPYKLPSGRTVRLRGKWDSVDLAGEGREKGIYLQENKTKGDINEVQLRRQVSFDLQTMMYLTALHERPGNWNPALFAKFSGQRILGIRYNVVRRPLSGGKGTIRQHQPTKSNPRGESKEEFYSRLAGLIQAEPETYFMRWKIEITPGDILKFRRECLDPVLEQLCDWWRWIVASGTNSVFSPDDGCEDTISASQSPSGVDRERPINSSIHWRHPFGVYSPMDEGNASDLDEFLATGSEIGLQRTDNLFPELT